MLDSKRTYLLLLVLGMALTISAARAQSNTNGGATPTTTTQSKVPASSDVKLSQAERILRLEQSIELTRTELAQLKTELDNPESEYGKSKAEFTRLDKRLKERELELTTQPAEDPKRLDGLRNARETAKERFDLAIQGRAASEQKYTLLLKKLEQDTAVLSRLRGPGATASQPAAASMPAAAERAEGSAPTTVAPPAPQATPQSQTPPTVSLPMPPSAVVAQPPAEQTQPAPVPMAKELLAAQQEAAKLRAAATAAEQELEMVAARISTLRDSIKIEQARLETAQQQSANSQKAYKSARDYAQKLISTGAAADNINTALNRVDDAEARMAAAEKEVELREEGLEILQSELTELQAEHGASLREAERKRTEAAKANEEVKRLQNPYSLFRIMQWVIDHGPAILGILVGMFVLLWVIKVTEHRIVHLIAGRSDTGTESERESRAKTLASVFRNVSSTAIVVGGVLMLLSEVDINIVPLLGAAGVVGLAVAFGAQSLIKDYFSGFIILLENQYAINDVVKIGDTAGMVEHISLRMTLLRDVEGNAHFIPHGEIKSVTNMTHGWSRAVFDIGVAYKEQVDKVMKVLMELAREIRRDPAFSPLILDDPEMLGVDKLDDSAVVIRFLIKTRPLRQWTIKREMLRRIKNRFDELGIEIPFPHRTVYHQYQSNGQAEGSEGGTLAPLGDRSHQRE